MKPNYYQLNIKGVECDVNDILKAWSDKIKDMSYMDFNYYSNAIEYILRSPFKGQQENDLKKAITELNFILKNNKDIFIK